MEKETADAARAAHISRLVDMAARHTPLSSTCLHRSLVLWWLLRRRGVHSTLRFGARKRDDHFEAHAWVECAGMAINDDPMIHRDYTSLEFALFKPDA